MRAPVRRARPCRLGRLPVPGTRTLLTCAAHTSPYATVLS
jgi:hypothetical protein